MMRVVLAALAVVGALSAPLALGQDRARGREVVVYTALDQFYSEPILRRFEQETGIVVRPRYDTEATKTTGLFNRIVAERRRPRCDVFWNNEVLRTVALKQLGLLEPYRAPKARDIPARFKDSEGYWTGFAARARVIVYNTNILTSRTVPRSVFDLAKPRWRGRCAIAYPLFGTTATHFGVLYSLMGERKALAFFRALRDNDVQVLDGNAMVCRAVARGELAWGLTDTDDVHAAQLDGKPVAFVVPDQGPGDIGALIIPNTLALIKNCPHPRAGKRLIDFLLDAEVENALAVGRSAQIPVRPTGVRSSCGVELGRIRVMPFDYERAARAMKPCARKLQEIFVR